MVIDLLVGEIPDGFRVRHTEPGASMLFMQVGSLWSRCVDGVGDSNVTRDGH
ncbi:hypothetical protein ACFWDQ_13530 [Streptomyces sp. NPDC060053]|uniref:hypothetical protein n=1 Tax=Streptomyces sp. NPDC060053 TaxID=3347047 RepID=UPI0036981C60